MQAILLVQLTPDQINGIVTTRLKEEVRELTTELQAYDAGILEHDIDYEQDKLDRDGLAHALRYFLEDQEYNDFIIEIGARGELENIGQIKF